MKKVSRTELKKYMRSFIDKILVEEGNDLKPLLLGMKKQLRVKHSITEKQWNVLVGFMSSYSGKTKSSLRRNFDPVIGKDWRRQQSEPVNTLAKFFENDSDDGEI